MSSGSVGKAILVGNVTREPVVKTTNTGKKVASFSVAVNRMKEGEADFHNVVTWEKLAEVAEKYILKGTKVYVEGRLQNRTYEDKEGNKKYITEIIATDLTLLGTKPTGTPDADTTPQPTPDAAPDAPVADDIDF
jgi:single-strand DNA-binding protein